MTSELVKTFNPFKEAIPDTIYSATRIWNAWLKSIFALRPVGGFHWVPNETETEIVIMDQGPYNIENKVRPAIITVMGPATWASAGKMYSEFLGGNEIHTAMSSCTVAINCVANEGTVARKLGYLVYRLIPVFDGTLKKYGIHGVMQNLAMSPESPPGTLVAGSSSPEWSMVSVQVPFMIQDTLAVKQDDESFHAMVRSITISMESILGG